MPTRSIGVTDARSLPVYFITRSLLKVYRPKKMGILAYNALAYAADGSRCRDLSIKELGELVDLSESGMKRGLAELVAIKAVLVKPRWRKAENGKRMALPNEYILIDLPERSDLPI